MILADTSVAAREPDQGWEWCETKEHLLAHCEGYCVVGPDGPVGYVEEVRLSPEGDTAEQLVVRRTDDYRKLVVPVALIEAVEPAGERLRIGKTPE